MTKIIPVQTEIVSTFLKKKYIQKLTNIHKKRIRKRKEKQLRKKLKEIDIL